MGLNRRKKQNFSVGSSENKKMFHKNLEFIAAEQYKMIRESLGFVLPEDEKCPVIGITSSMRGEGKSTTSVNLSYVLAEKGNRVLLIDGDLRLPSIAKKLDIESSPGLTDLLKGKGAQIAEYKSSILNTWYILPAGEIPPNPSELLGSKRMENVLNALKDAFDYIIIDLPPVNIVSDAVSISGLLSGMIVVIRENYTEKKELDQCFRQLSFANVKVLGSIITYSDEYDAAAGNAKKSKYYKYKGPQEKNND